MVDGKITVTTSGTTLTSHTHSEATETAKSMYDGDAQVESDLVSGAAWDTALMYIQKFSTVEGIENYANSTASEHDEDRYCNIINLAKGRSE